MQPTDLHYQSYVQVLREELVPAMGCTEPIAVAYGAAKAREVLGCLPDKVLVEASGNIIKNVKSVVVPNTGGLHGIEASAAAGIVAGKAELVLEVISQVTDREKQAIRDAFTFSQLCRSHIAVNRTDTRDCNTIFICS